MGASDRFVAAQDFERARSRANLQDILARLRGKPAELLSYEDVKHRVQAGGIVSQEVKDIPIDAIVGSVGRYNDFTKSFLPKQDSDKERWVNVKLAAEEPSGLPPIEVYKIGDAYFVHDGHHRVSVAAQAGARNIEAIVTEIRTRVPIDPDVDYEALLLKSEYAEFLEQTKLDELRPGADFSITVLGRYRCLLRHIEVHRYYMGLEQEREISYSEAVTSWYDNVYSPVVVLVEETGILQNFPGRTETDLYLWLADHRAELVEQLGWDVPYTALAMDLAEKERSRLSALLGKIGRRVLNIVTPDAAHDGSTWQREHKLSARRDSLFADILVAISGSEEGWIGLEQALKIAVKEHGRVLGLYVYKTEVEDEDSAAQGIKERFEARCAELGLPHRFITSTGPIFQTICEHTKWADLVVAHVDNPPDKTRISKISSNFRKLIKSCSRPVLAVPDIVSELERPMLVYDGSTTSDEALFLAAQLAGAWERSLHVLITAGTSYSIGDLEAKVKQQTDQMECDAQIIVAPDRTSAGAVLDTAGELGCDLLIVGGYDSAAVVDLVTSTLIDELLVALVMPVLVAQ